MLMGGKPAADFARHRAWRRDRGGEARLGLLRVSFALGYGSARPDSRAAMGKIGRIPPYKIEGRVTIEVEYSTRHAEPVRGLSAFTAKISWKR
jgi:hypothetical protein